jgi:hypothetical protein
VQSAGDAKQNGAVPIHIPGSANASLLSKIAVTAKIILNRIIEASRSVTDVEGLQSGYPDPPQKIFEQPETPVKNDHPHVARLTRDRSRSLLSFPFMVSRRDFGRAAGPEMPMPILAEIKQPDPAGMGEVLNRNDRHTLDAKDHDGSMSHLGRCCRKRA